MSRLIDAERFKRFLQALCKAGAPYDDVIQLLDKEPTAYDISKVVAELEEKENEWWDTYSLSSGFDEYAHGKSVGFEEAIDIVKAGGWNE